MNKKEKATANNEATAKPVSVAEQASEKLENAKTEMVIAEINKILADNNRTLQCVMEGYPFMLRPAVRVVPIPQNVQAAPVKEDGEKQAENA